MVACTRKEASCILGNFFGELCPICEICRELLDDELALKTASGLTLEGEAVLVIEGHSSITGKPAKVSSPTTASSSSGTSPRSPALEMRGAATLEPSILQKKAEIFLERDVYPLLKNFPQAEKFSLSQEIKQSCFRLIRAAVMANNLTVVKKRLEWLDEADAEKTLLLVLFGVARTQKYITEKKIHELQTKLNEMGRIIGGLQKHFINNR